MKEFKMNDEFDCITVSSEFELYLSKTAGLLERMLKESIKDEYVEIEILVKRPESVISTLKNWYEKTGVAEDYENNGISIRFKEPGEPDFGAYFYYYLNDSMEIFRSPNPSFSDDYLFEFSDKYESLILPFIFELNDAWLHFDEARRMLWSPKFSGKTDIITYYE